MTSLTNMDMALFRMLFLIPARGRANARCEAVKSLDLVVSRISASSMARGKNREVTALFEMFFTKKPFLPYAFDRV